jgi:sugar lactone lactonase YvrE
MRHASLHARRGAAAVALLLAVSGCASKQKPDVFFPPPPDKPRIKWVRSIHSEDDLGQGAWRKIVKAVIPHDSLNSINSPTSLALSPDERTLYVAMPHASRVVAIDLDKKTFTAIGTTGRTPLAKPIGVGTDAEGRLYVSDKAASSVAVYSRDGELVERFGREQLVEPTGLAVDRKNRLVYVVNEASTQEGRHTVEVFSLAGKHLRTMGAGGPSPEPGKFKFPRSVAVSRTGEAYVVDMLNFRVQVFDARGALLRTFGSPGAGYPGQFDKIHSVAFDAFDNVYVADAMQGVHILNPDARPLMMFGPPVARATSAIVIDSKNRIYVGDLLHQLHEFQLVNTTAADSRPDSKPASGAAAKPAAAPAKPAR